MKLRRSMWLLAWAGVCLAAVGCEDERPEPSLNQFVPPGNDAGQDAGDDTVADERPEPLELPPAEDICEAGQVRCLSTGQQQIEVCAVPEGASVEVTRWVPGLCPEGQTCQRNACAPLECIPEQPTCDGQGALGICGADGASVVEAQPCPGDSVCRRGVCIDLCEAAAADRSYIGCQYMVVDLPNPFDTEGSRGSPFGLVVANPEGLLDVTLRLERPDGTPEVVLAEATVTPTELATPARPVTVRSSIRDARGEVVATPSGPADEVVVPPGGVATLLLARQRLPHTSSGVFAQGRRLIASRPVVAYQYNPYCCNFSFTNDASLLLPVSALGTAYVATGAADWAFDPDRDSIGMSLTVAATEDQTRVKVRLDDTMRLYRDPSGRVAIPAVLDEQEREFEVELAAGELLHLQSHSDSRFRSSMTGARIETSHPAAVFSGHPCTFIPHSKGACDHLEEQLIPEDTWGTRYLLTPPFPRTESATELTYWRLVTGDVPAQVTLSQGFDALQLYPPFASVIQDCRRLRDSATDNTTFLLPAGADCMLASRRPMGLEASAPVQITGFIAGEFAATSANTQGTGDPSMFLLPPVAQFRDDYRFLTPETYALDFATVVIPREALGGMTLDGLPLDPQAPGLSGLTIPGSNHVIVHIPVGDGSHRLQATVPFGLLVYAYDRFVSYAYTGGLNLTKRK